MQEKIIKLFLRVAISFGFISAVADRFGYWPKEISAWYSWDAFLEYTALINPFAPESLIPALGIIATITEVIFACCLIIGFKTELFAKLSGFLILSFALAMASSTGIKGVFDYSVLATSAGGFALSTMKDKYFELDVLLKKSK